MAINATVRLILRKARGLPLKVGCVVVILLLALAPFSIGPAVLTAGQGWTTALQVSKLYRPLLWLRWRSPSALDAALLQYMEWWDPDMASEVCAAHTCWELGVALPE